MLHVLPRIPDWVYEVIVVDGLSKDATVRVARETRPGVRVVFVDTPGKGAAMRAGFEAARGDIVVCIDADGSTDPSEIPAFVGHLVAGADVAVGTRFAAGGGSADMEWYRRMGNWGLTRIVRFVFGARYSDLCYGYVAFWREVLPLLDGDFTGFEVETVLHIRAVRSGLRVAEVPSFEEQRIWGSSNLRTIRDGFRVLGAIAREWSVARHEVATSDAAELRARRRERRHGGVPWAPDAVDANQTLTEIRT